LNYKATPLILLFRKTERRKLMSIRIDTLAPGARTKVLFVGNKSAGNDPYQLDLTFDRIEGEGLTRRAFFTDSSGLEIEAYRFNGQWSYGASAEPLRVLSVKRVRESVK
jgi:hypothetical protein